jgi:hypothetical protein
MAVIRCTVRSEYTCSHAYVKINVKDYSLEITKFRVAVATGCREFRFASTHVAQLITNDRTVLHVSSRSAGGILTWLREYCDV